MAKQSYSRHGELTENQLIFQQINRINNLSSSLQGLSQEDWGILVNRLELAIRSLRAMMTPLIDDEYRELKQEIDTKYNVNKANEKNKEDEDWIFQNQDYYLEIYSLLIDTLYRNSLFYNMKVDFTIEEDSEIKLDGVPLSEYDEEIKNPKKKHIKEGEML